MATENAVEGCVHETFSAAIAMMQAATAADGQVRAAMRSIAIDETEHAELAWAVARWVDTRLGRGGRARVRAALRHAADVLVERGSQSGDGDLARSLGLPDACQSAAIARRLHASLWR